MTSIQLALLTMFFAAKMFLPKETFCGVSEKHILREDINQHQRLCIHSRNQHTTHREADESLPLHPCSVAHPFRKCYYSLKLCVPPLNIYPYLLYFLPVSHLPLHLTTLSFCCSV